MALWCKIWVSLELGSTDLVEVGEDPLDCPSGERLQKKKVDKCRPWGWSSMPSQELQPDVYCFAAVSHYGCPLNALVLGTIFQTEI